MCIIKADVKSWQIIAYRKRVPDMRKKWIRLIAAAMGSFLLAGCGADTQIDDYATNAGAESVQQTSGTESAAFYSRPHQRFCITPLRWLSA